MFPPEAGPPLAEIVKCQYYVQADNNSQLENGTQPARSG